MKKGVSLGLGLALAVIAALSGLFFLSTRRFIAVQSRSNHTLAVKSELERALALIAEAESGQRGFVITGAREFLAPYFRGRAELDPTLSSLRRLTADNPRQQTCLDRLEPLARLKMDFAREVVELRERGRGEEARRLIAGEQGLRQMQEITGLIEAMTAEEERLLAEREASLRWGTGAVYVFFALLTVGVCALLGVVYRLIAREAGARAASEERLRRETLLAGLLRDAAVATNEAQTVEDAFKRCLEKVCVATGWPAGRLFLHDEGREGAFFLTEVSHTDGNPRGVGAFTQRPTREADPLIGRAVATAAPAWAGGHVAVPVALGDEVVAVLEFYCPDTGPPDAKLLEALALVATQLGRSVERERAMSKLWESETLHRHLALNASDVLCVVDAVTDEFDWYGQIDRALGYEEGEFPRTLAAWREHIHPEDRARVMEAYERSGAEGAPFYEFYRIARRDGSYVYWAGRATPVYGPYGDLVKYIGACTDVTARMEAEEALAEQRAELARSNAELEQFAYVASHDLQEPLRMVGSYTQLLARRYGGRLDSEADEFIGYAVDGVKRMQLLINDLLTYSRVGRGERRFAPCDLRAVFADVIKNLQVAVAEAGAAIECGELPEVEGDPVQLAQLFQNLVANAVKFRGPDLPRVTVLAAREGREWRFRVADNGIGFAPEYAERIFVIFQRLHGRGAYEGTGIGLAVSKKIIERHGGRIWAESEPGRGSTFNFTLPMRRAA